jgi:hypothetical protein
MAALQSFGLQSRNLGEVGRRFEGTNMKAAENGAGRLGGPKRYKFSCRGNVALTIG